MEDPQGSHMPRRRHCGIQRDFDKSRQVQEMQNPRQRIVVASVQVQLLYKNQHELLHGPRRERVGLEKRAEVLDMGAAARGTGRGSPRLSLNRFVPGRNFRWTKLAEDRGAWQELEDDFVDFKL